MMTNVASSSTCDFVNWDKGLIAKRAPSCKRDGARFAFVDTIVLILWIHGNYIWEPPETLRELCCIARNARQ